jgi:hypothetical protein
MFKRIFKELEHHAPFTLLGALTGIFIMLIFKNLPSNISYNVFYTLHPLHVFLSALTTASIYKIHALKTKKFNILFFLIISYIASIGVGTLSDSLIPYFSESLLKLPNRELHIGFLEKAWLVNGSALLGIAIGYFRQNTKVSHTLHVLVSTWASLFHILMALSNNVSILFYFLIFIFLFIAVWVPCCCSDIVLPLIFIGKEHKGECECKKWIQ